MRVLLLFAQGLRHTEEGCESGAVSFGFLDLVSMGTERVNVF